MIEFLANLASIATAALAAGATIYFWCDSKRKREKLEKYMKEEKANPRSKQSGKHSVVHLMAKLSLTESEVLHAAFRSSTIQTLAAKDDDTGLASEILLEHIDRKSN